MSSQPIPSATTERPTRVRYWVIVFAVTLAAVTYIDRVAISFAAPSIRRELGLTAVQMGWVFAAFNWAYALFEVPGGFLGDWLGPRRVLTRIVVWWSVFTAATGWVWSFPSLLTTRFLFGAGEAGCFPNVAKAFSTWLPERERVRAQGIMWLSARWAGAFTPPIVALIMTLVGWRRAFEVFGVLGIIWAVIFFIWYKDDPMKNTKMNQAERDLLRESSQLSAGHADVPWGKLFRSRQVLLLCGQFFCLNYGWWFYVTWLPTYLRENRGVDITSAALLSVLPLFMGGLGNPVCVFMTRLLVKRTGNMAFARRAMAITGFAGASSFVLLSTLMQDPLYAMLAIGFASFSNDLVMPGAWTSAMDVGGKYAGTVSGTMNMVGNFGGALAPIAIGYMLQATQNNWNLTFYVSAAVYAAGILFWSFLDPVTPLEKQAA